MSDFGSPGAGDATAKREKRILKASARRVNRLKRGERVINRPIGSIVDLPEEDQIADWQMEIEDPQGLLDKVGQRALAIGPQKAALELLRWDRDMTQLARDRQ
ncbi:hypothetical protein LCGC14_0879460 [marine sediment metagenome]|uniref:Uncharacterized protein n=1 Tax=marine sediment metagenome TaxID=412755 RepID=A0A0F9P782_9ZZZZ